MVQGAQEYEFKQKPLEWTSGDTKKTELSSLRLNWQMTVSKHAGENHSAPWSCGGCGEGKQVPSLTVDANIPTTMATFQPKDYCSSWITPAPLTFSCNFLPIRCLFVFFFNLDGLPS